MVKTNALPIAIVDHFAAARALVEILPDRFERLFPGEPAGGIMNLIHFGRANLIASRRSPESRASTARNDPMRLSWGESASGFCVWRYLTLAVWTSLCGERGLADPVSKAANETGLT